MCIMFRIEPAHGHMPPKCVQLPSLYPLYMFGGGVTKVDQGVTKASGALLVYTVTTASS